MIKYSFCIFLFIGIAFGQENKKEALVNQFFVAPNRSIVGNYFINGYGKTGFDLGVRHIFKPNKKNTFVYGLEFNYTRFFMNSHPFTGHSGSYSNSDLSYCFISNSLVWKNKFGKKERFFIENGLFFDILLNSHIKGTFSPYNSTPYLVDEKFYGANYLGLSSAFGYVFNLNNIELSVKSELKIKLIQIQNDFYVRNIGYTRVCFALRKIN